MTGGASPATNLLLLICYFTISALLHFFYTSAVNVQCLFPTNSQSRFDRAEELYVRAQSVDPRNANLHVHRALIALQSRGDVPKAVELIREGLAVDDKCEFAYETLGTIEVQVRRRK